MRGWMEGRGQTTARIIPNCRMCWLLIRPQLTRRAFAPQNRMSPSVRGIERGGSRSGVGACVRRWRVCLVFSPWRAPCWIVRDYGVAPLVDCRLVTGQGGAPVSRLAGLAEYCRQPQHGAIRSEVRRKDNVALGGRITRGRASFREGSWRKLRGTNRSTAAAESWRH
jgi:hypothetical protein